MTATTADPAVDVPGTPPPAPDLCWRCDYDLRGIRDDQPCPECGLLAERSRRPTEHLTDARPGWLLRLSAGVWSMLLAHVLVPVWLYFLDDVEGLIQHWYYQPGMVGEWVLHFPMAGFDLAALLLLAGAWLLTRPEPAGRPDGGAAGRRAALMRLAACVPVSAVGVVHWAIERERDGFGSETWHWVVPAVLLTIGCVPLPALTFYHLRHLARRVLSPSLAEHCAIVGWGASITLAAIPALYGLFLLGGHYGGHHWETRSDAALLIGLVALVAPALFLLWSGLTMVRFAVAFARAHRGARRKWAAADRSGSGTGRLS